MDYALLNLLQSAYDSLAPEAQAQLDQAHVLGQLKALGGSDSAGGSS